MANGSFGLSGFPTAPTTISGAGGGGANNPTSSVTTSVLSTSGFDAGELIYQRNNDFGTIPNNAVATGTFSINGTAVVMGGAVMDQARTGNTTNLGVYGEAFRSEYAARLSNGNVVIVFKALATSTATGWATTINCAHFKIVTEDGVTVVNTTCIDTVNTVNTSTISVVGLSTGGFVIAYRNTSNQIRYGVYTNTGTVTTALQNDTTSSNVASDSQIMLGARSDGNWVIAYQNTNPQMLAKVFSNTGVQVHAWVATGLGVNPSSGKTQMVVRGDNTVVLIGVLNNTAANYSVLSATNTVTVNAASYNIGGGTSLFSAQGADACLLPNGNVAFCSMLNTGNLLTFILSPTNVLDGGTQVSIGTGNQYANGMSIIGTSTNGVFVTFVGAGNTVPSIAYVTIAPALNAVSVAVQTIPYLGNSNANNFPILIDTGTYIGMFYTPYTTSTPHACINLTRFSKTTFQVVNYTEASFPAGTTTAAVSGYARSASTPTSASFLAAATTTINGNIIKTTGSFATPVQIGIGTFIELDSMTFADGRFGFIGRTGAGAIIAYVYSASGTLITTINVATGSVGSAQTAFTCRMVELGNGIIAMCYMGAATTTAVVAVYSAAYAPLGTTNFTVRTLGSFNGLNMAAISGSRICVSYTNSSNQPAFRIFSDALATLTAETTVLAESGVGQVTCAAVDSGIQIAFAAPSATRFYSYFESATNVWSGAGPTNFGSTGFSSGGNKLSYRTGNGFYVVPANTDGSNLLAVSLSNQSSTAGYGPFNVLASSNGGSALASCFTTLGTSVVVVRADSTTVRLYSQPTSYSGSTPAIVNLSISTSPSSNFSLTPFVGNQVIFSYFSSATSTYVYTILNAEITPYSATVTAGTVSQPALLPSPANGYTLLGVSTTAAPANGTGTVQINGPATLNSQYPATTNQAFDFQNPSTFGVAGVINGRNVNLQGNV